MAVSRASPAGSYPSSTWLIRIGPYLEVPSCTWDETRSFADGRPVGGGTIDIKPLDASGRAARAAIGVDGHFRLETAGRRGVRAGRYRVAVRPQLVVGHPAHGPAVAPRHGAFDGSGIEFEVPRGGREDLVVTVEAAD